MVQTKRRRNYRKTFKTPRRAYEKERLDQELTLCGEFGLRCKKEIWRVQLVLAKIRKTARQLLTLDDKDPKRIFEGHSLMRRLVRYGLLGEDERKLDYVLQLGTQKLLQRRLQTLVAKLGHAKSIHHARVIIRQRHVRVDSERHIGYTMKSPLASSQHFGRVARKKNAAAAGGDEDDE
eukprot:GSMAST32.ASY1.ANO1.687.1 assembled CDS